MQKSIVATTIAFITVTSNAGIFDEGTLGDFSDDRFMPTVLDFDLGINTVISETVNSNNTNTGDRDYFTFTLGAGESIDSITLVDASNPLGGFDATAFVGMSFDSVFDFDPDAQTGPGLVGFVLTFPALIGADVLPDLSGGLSELGPGDYTLWLQQTGGDLTSVQLDFNVVPAPTAATLLGLGGLVALRRRR